MSFANLSNLLSSEAVASVGGNLLSTVGTVTNDVAGAVSGPVAAPQPGGPVLGAVGDILHFGDPAAAVSDAIGPIGRAVDDLGGAVTGVLGEVAQAADQPLPQTLNDIVTHLHVGLEGAGHELGLTRAVHGVTDLGETIGLGEIGGDNLLTDVFSFPDALASDDLPGSSDIFGHVSDIVDAAPGPVTGLLFDVDRALGDTGGGELGALPAAPDALHIL